MVKLLVDLKILTFTYLVEDMETELVWKLAM